VSRVGVADLVLALAERLHEAVDAVTRKSEDGVDSPGEETIDKQSEAV
jgi:hypothetical protein